MKPCGRRSGGVVTHTRDKVMADIQRMDTNTENAITERLKEEAQGLKT